MRKSRNIASEVESIRHALVVLRRLLQRRELVELWESAFGQTSQMDYTDLKLLDAVETSRAEAGESATVGQISLLLGVDPSRASRLVAQAVQRGLLVRHAEQGDARKVLLNVTRKGAKLQEMGSQLTRSRIALAMQEWTERDRARFAKLFTQFVAKMLPRTDC